jgi:hypothetical protein
LESDPLHGASPSVTGEFDMISTTDVQVRWTGYQSSSDVSINRLAYQHLSIIANNNRKHV